MPTTDSSAVHVQQGHVLDLQWDSQSHDSGACPAGARPRAPMGQSVEHSRDSGALTCTTCARIIITYFRQQLAWVCSIIMQEE